MTVAPPTIELTVEASLHGVRIDTFLARHLRNYSSWRLARLVAARQVHIDFVPAAPDRRVVRGERVQVRLIEPPDKLLEPEPHPVPILYEDHWLLVVDKPAGVVSHPTGDFQTGTLANILQWELDRRTPLRGLVRPGIVHRLDRQTSGLMVVATTHQSHAALSTAFEHGRVSKTYLALVSGHLKRDSGTIDLPIGRSSRGRGVLMSARADAVDRKPALTYYKVLKQLPGCTLVEVQPRTGRNHQIRVHFAHIGHPLLGDEFYLPRGAYRTPRSAVRALRSGLDVPQPAPASATLVDSPISHAPALPDDSADQSRHALHASRLEFAHPLTGVWMKFHSHPPDDFRRLAITARDCSSVPADAEHRHQ